MRSGYFGAVPFESKVVIALVSGSEFVNHTYIVVLPPVLGLVADDFGVSLALLGVALGVMNGANAAFQLPFGYVADRRDRTLGLGLSLGLGGAGVLLTAAAESFAVLVLAQALVGVGLAAHHPNHFPLLSEAVAEEYRGRVFSARGFAGALGFATPPMVVTAVLALPGTSWRHAVGVVGGLGLVYGILALVLFRRFVSEAVTKPAPDAGTDPGRGSVLARLREELATIASMRAVLAVGALSFASALAVNGFRTFVVVHLTDGYGLGLTAANLTFTALFGASAGLILVGGLLADRLRVRTVLITAFGLSAVLLAVLGSLLVPAAVAMIVVVAIGGAQAVAGPARSKLVDRYAPSGSLGQSFAVMSVGMMSGATVAPPLFGVLIEAAGLRVAFLGIAVVAALALLIAVAVVSVYDS